MASQIKNSRSYRLGNAIAAPYHWIITWWRAVTSKHRVIKKSASDIALLRVLLARHIAQIRVVSFDIFDTLLERDIDPPDEVKWMVARRIKRTLLDDYGISCPVERAMALRNEIENDLRGRVLNAGMDSECKFSDIARALAARLVKQNVAHLAARIIEHELEAEAEVLFVKPKVAEILAWLNSRGVRVIAMSDMYLDQAHLQHIFENKGLTAHFEHIYVSSEFGICKHSGRLFEHVLKQEDIQPSELLHIGDNRHSDCRAPAKMGIHTIHFDDKASIRRRLTLRAYRYLAARNPYWKGRYLLQIVRPMAPQGFHHDYGYKILGPIYAAFILGVIEALRKHHIRHVYFLAREGELFMKLFQLIAPKLFERDQIPEIHYLYVSRHSTSSASAHKGLSYEAAIVPLFNPKQQGLYSICNAFGLPAEAFASVSKKHGYASVKQPIYDWGSAQFKRMLDDADFQQIVMRYTSKSWRLLHTYLAQHHFFDQKRVALVDIGWNGSIQKFFQEAFGADERYPHVLGLYLGFIGGLKHNFNTTKNTIIGMLCDERSNSRPKDIFSRFEELFEEGARALHPTTTGYRIDDQSGRVEPVFKQDTTKDRIAELRANSHIEQFQAGIMNFGAEFARAVDLTGYGFNDIKPFILTIAERAVAFPTQTEIQELMQLGHSEDFGFENVMDFRHEKSNGWRALLRPRRLVRLLLTANWKYGTAGSTGIPGLNVAIRFYDLIKSK